MIVPYTLLVPFNFGGTEYTELQVTKPNGKILKKFKSANLGDFAEQIKLVAACINEPEPFVEVMDLDDLMGVVNMITEWFLKAADNKPSL